MHTMTEEVPYPGQHKYTCNTCDRVVIVDHGRLTVIHPGDFAVLHNHNMSIMIGVQQ